MRSRWVVFLCAAVLTACGRLGANTPSSSPSNSPTASPSAYASVSASPSASASTFSSVDVLFAAEETHGQGDGFGAPDTVVIVGLDGYARAKQRFTPLTPPYLGCLGTLIPPQAYVVAGRVFYIDGLGVVRGLGRDGSVNRVASIPLTTQQEASFAVSPDARHILANVLTIPPKSASDPCGYSPGSWKLDTYASDDGGQTRLLSHQEWPQESGRPDIPQFVGWTAIGPIATDPSVLGTQGGGPAHWYGPIVQVNAATGAVMGHLGPDWHTCRVTDVVATGSYVCVTSQGVSVFNPDNSPAWHFDRPSEGFTYALLSPDAQRVAAVGNSSQVIRSDGTLIRIADAPGGSGFFYTGWLDGSTLIGWLQVPEMAIVRLNAPNQPIDLGFKGFFVATIRPGPPQ